VDFELDFESLAIEVNKTEIKKQRKKKRETLCDKADEADDR
jgi:hypothetical protein